MFRRNPREMEPNEFFTFLPALIFALFATLMGGAFLYQFFNSVQWDTLPDSISSRAPLGETTVVTALATLICLVISGVSFAWHYAFDYSNRLRDPKVPGDRYGERLLLFFWIGVGTSVVSLICLVLSLAPMLMAAICVGSVCATASFYYAIFAQKKDALQRQKAQVEAES